MEKGTRLHGGKDAASPRYIFTNLSSFTRSLFNQKDDPLFDYINDDGQRVEPTYYCPILPLILVNGAEGIGTGWAVKIPNYNVRDLINNLRRMINKEEPLAMIPFYKNFRGTIEQVDESKFVVSGEVALIEDDESSSNKGDRSVEISELPVGTWTQAYKESVLEAFLHGSGDASNNKAGFVPLISDYKEYHTDCTVRFVVKMSGKQFQQALDHGGLHKFFKLQKTISTGNMVLFDPNGCLKRYETALDILGDYFHVRLEYYAKRKEYLQDLLGAECLKLDNIARFILEKIQGKIKVENLKKKDLIHQLEEKGYDSDPIKKWKETITKEKGYLHESGHTGEHLIGEADLVTDSARGQSDFNYLLAMPLWNLTLEKKEEILKQQREKNKELNDLKAKSKEQLWLDDLNEFSEILDSFEAKEKLEVELTVKKSLSKQQKSSKSSFDVNAFLKRNSLGSTKFEYLPSATGERVKPLVDPQLIAKFEKEAQLKSLVKAKKDEEAHSMTLVDIVTNDAVSKYDDEQLKAIQDIALSFANPTPKIKATKPNQAKKSPKKEGDEEISNETLKTPEKKKAINKASKKVKLTVNSDSEKSFGEDNFNDEPENIAVERRKTSRAIKEVKYKSLVDGDDSEDDDQVILTFDNEISNKKGRQTKQNEIISLNSDSDSDFGVKKKSPNKKSITTPKNKRKSVEIVLDDDTSCSSIEETPKKKKSLKKK